MNIKIIVLKYNFLIILLGMILMISSLIGVLKLPLLLMFSLGLATILGMIIGMLQYAINSKKPVPNEIEIEQFEKDIIVKVTNSNDKKFILTSYIMDIDKKKYVLISSIDDKRRIKIASIFNTYLL